MKTVIKRIARLECRLAPTEIARKPFRVVVTRMDRRANLANSTCKRTLLTDGSLMEVVRLDGMSDGLSEGELEQFIASFSIQTVQAV
jgi:hypothetical protein